MQVAKFWNQPLSEIRNLKVYEYKELLKQTEKELKKQNG